MNYFSSKSVKKSAVCLMTPSFTRLISDLYLIFLVTNQSFSYIDLNPTLKPKNAVKRC
jgi:hypothetical protein